MDEDSRSSIIENVSKQQVALLVKGYYKKSFENPWKVTWALSGSDGKESAGNAEDQSEGCGTARPALQVDSYHGATGNPLSELL